MCQCIQFSQLIGGTKKITLFTIIHKKFKKNVYTINICSMYKWYNKTKGI